MSACVSLGGLKDFSKFFEWGQEELLVEVVVYDDLSFFEAHRVFVLARSAIQST